MKRETAFQWVVGNARRVRVLNAISQPLTSTQLARRLNIERRACARVLRDLATGDLLQCLNWKARQNRVYWLTDLGFRCQRHTWQHQGRAVIIHECPAIDWDLYGWACYRHRSTVICVLRDAMQPSTVKQKARSEYPGARMSANNVRDVIRLFRQRGIVRALRVRKKAHPLYELTKQGREFRRLLIQAESQGST